MQSHKENNCIVTNCTWENSQTSHQTRYSKNGIGNMGSVPFVHWSFMIVENSLQKYSAK